MTGEEEKRAENARIQRRTGLSPMQWRALCLIHGGDYWLYDLTGGARVTDHARRPGRIVHARTLRVLRFGGLVEIDPTFHPRLRLTAAGKAALAEGRAAAREQVAPGGR